MKQGTKNIWSHYLMELLIVIIGITIAFWLNNVGIKNQNNAEKKVYLKDINNDLKTDSSRLAFAIKNNEAKLKKLNYTLGLIEQSAPIDTLLPNVLSIGSYNFFTPDNFTLTSMLQSGDLKLIDSEEIKKELLRLLQIYELVDNAQNNFLEALDNNYFPMFINKVDMAEGKATDSTFFYNIQVKNYCAYTLEETRQHVDIYKYVQEQISKLRELIDSDLRED